MYNFKNRAMSVCYKDNALKCHQSVAPFPSSKFNNFNASRRIHAKSRSTYQNLRQDIARTRTSKRKSQM